MTTHVGVMFGGKSTEHEVSITSAYAVIKNLQKYTSYEITPIYVAKNGQRYSDPSLMDLKTYKNFTLPAHQVSVEIQQDHKLHISFDSAKLFGKKEQKTLDVIFLVFHGKNGEDGSIEGMLDFLEVPYVGPSVLGAATTIDKRTTKDILLAHNLPAIPYLSFDATTLDFDKIEDTFSYPLFVKPYNGGSSIGVSKCFSRDDLVQGCEVGLHFSHEILVEPSIEHALELSISVMEHEWVIITTEIQQPLSAESFLTFDQKYIVEKWWWGMSGVADKVLIPAPVSPEITAHIKDMCKHIYRIFRLTWAPRIDFLYQPDLNKLSIIEINTIPGAMQMFLREKSWVSPKTFLESLIKNALSTSYDSTSIDFSSSILDNTISFAK